MSEQTVLEALLNITGGIFFLSPHHEVAVQCTYCERYHVEILTCIVSVRPREAASTKSPPPCWAACA